MSVCVCVCVCEQGRVYFVLYIGAIAGYMYPFALSMSLYGIDHMGFN